MTDVAVCTDSSALLTQDEAGRLGIDVVPVHVLLDGERFDESSHDLDDFYARLESGATAATSQPSPGELAAAYALAAARGATAGLSLHLDGRVSGTLDAARLAARHAPIPVTVVDTGSVSFGVGVCARAAADLLAGGASIEETLAHVDRLGASLANAFVTADAPGGRLERAQGWNVLTFADGAGRPLAACSNAEEAAAAMAARVLGSTGRLRAAVGHAGPRVARGADALAAALDDLPHVVAVERYRLGAAVGAHTGSLSFGVFWWPTAEM